MKILCKFVIAGYKLMYYGNCHIMTSVALWKKLKDIKQIMTI